MSLNTGILCGWDKILQEGLRIGCGVESKTATREFLAGQSEISIDLIKALYDQIKNNCAPVNPNSLSTSNWRWESQPKIADHNPSVEKWIEKTLARCFSDKLTNQVPAASDLAGKNQDRKRSIDLVLRGPGEKTYQFIELKITGESGWPLYAAFEVLSYGLLYLHARRELDGRYPGKALMEANTVHLRVLAPVSYYSEWNSERLRTRLVKPLDKALRQFAGKSVVMDFGLSSFPKDFEPSDYVGKDFPGLTKAFQCIETI